MRAAFTLIHRWIGLAIAAFLFVSGLTGAVISWDHELDEILNAHLTESSSTGSPVPPLELARQIEERDPRVRVVALPLSTESDHSIDFVVQPRVDPATGRLFEPGYNQVFLDPVTGEELGRRQWGRAWPISTETFVSFLYVLHYSLHIPEMWSIDRWGLWFMGAIALIWTVDCFIGFYLTLPVRHAPNPSRPSSVERVLQRGWWQRWKPAWKIKTSGSVYRKAFDLHRAFGLWTWLLLFILAFTGFSLNLYREIFHPLMSIVSKVTPTPFDERTAREKHDPATPIMTFRDMVDLAAREREARGWKEPLGSLYYHHLYDIYGAYYFFPGDDHGAAGVGPASIFFDGKDGRMLGERLPWTGTAADVFVQAQFPLHSGRILGMPGRIVVSIVGVVVSVLSVTGVFVWYRKRRARLAVARSRMARPDPVAAG